MNKKHWTEALAEKEELERRKAMICRSCGCSKYESPTIEKNWRKDRCNRCYAKENRARRREAIDTGKPLRKRGRPKGARGTPRTFGTTIPYTYAALFKGLSTVRGMLRTELLVEMLDDAVDRYVAKHATDTGVSRAEIEKIGRKELEAKDWSPSIPEKKKKRKKK